jgi:hypothetical protein
MRALIRACVISLLVLLARPVQAQLPVYIAGFAGAAFDVGSDAPNSGGGFSYQGQIGARVGKVVVGAEYGHHTMGQDRKAQVFGALIRIPALATGIVRPYFVAGIAEYKYAPSIGGKSRALGGSAGLGAFFTFGSEQVGAVLEARFHSAVSGLGSLSSREFAAVLAGLQIGL